MGVGLNSISSVTPEFYFFLKGIIIVYEIKINSYDFQNQTCNIHFTQKTISNFQRIAKIYHSLG